MLNAIDAIVIETKFDAMKKELEHQLEELLNNVEDKAELDLLRSKLFKRGVEKLLQAELTAQIGHGPYENSVSDNKRNGFSSKTLKTSDGDVEIKVPRDRQGAFDPVTVPKHKTMSLQLEEVMISLYAKGMSTADIVDFVEQTYGVQYSRTQVSTITNSLLEDIQQWQSRPLDDQYAIVWIDAIYYKIREDGRVKSKACLVVLGVNTEGYQDILGLYIYEQESASVWMQVFEDLKLRGVGDILFVCSDNLSGLSKAIEAAFPRSISQICIVHQIRNSLKYVSFKDRKSIMKDIKLIYQADNIEQAEKALEQFRDKWSSKYHKSVKSWEANWEHLTVFLNYPSEIRRLIYTTNIIESFNASLRKYTNNKKVFPNDQAAIKSIYLAAMNVRRKWEKKRFKWAQIYNQLTIFFPERLK